MVFGLGPLSEICKEAGWWDPRGSLSSEPPTLVPSPWKQKPAHHTGAGGKPGQWDLGEHCSAGIRCLPTRPASG